MELLIEFHRRLAPSYAIRLAHRLEEFDIRYFEEPCLSDNIELLAEVRRKVSLPVVTGETIYTKEEFSKVLSARAADILNPDICAVGGIGGLLDIDHAGSNRTRSRYFSAQQQQHARRLRRGNPCLRDHSELSHSRMFYKPHGCV